MNINQKQNRRLRLGEKYEFPLNFGRNAWTTRRMFIVLWFAKTMRTVMEKGLKYVTRYAEITER